MACLLYLLYVSYLTGYFPTVTGIPRTFNEVATIFSYQNKTCPAEKPFILKNGTQSICVSSCGPTLVIDGRNCINVGDCKKPVLSDGKCMEMCDEGYLYVTNNFELADDCSRFGSCFYSQNNIGQKLCEKRSDIILKTICYAIGTVLYILFLLMFFSTRQCPCTKLITWIKRQE
ncbi:uncharacterized protein LOC132717909 [Ruditapes philippinarum]|uniref:uncharacterized protein LOC132717909 n=1 Tax=Ruditapes philippinarum TaxID=129788 RepID=UPI00295AA428|nr:uncharacterized protein LOC132717909 [Ruditapes philippinarum]